MDDRGLQNIRGSTVLEGKDKVLHSLFLENDKGDKGYVTRVELQIILNKFLHQEFTMNHVETLYVEFDKNDDGHIDFRELQTMVAHFKEEASKRMSKVPRAQSLVISDLRGFSGEFSSFLSKESGGAYGGPAEFGISEVLDKAVKKAKKQSQNLLKSIIKSILPIKDILCIQDDIIEAEGESIKDSVASMHGSFMLDFGDLMDGEDSMASISEEEDFNPMDPEFNPAFPASDMRCLALVSHNGMKKTMREFVLANKNLLKLFRLTGTNSTMTMLREVFKDEPPGTVVFGPACASGPLGGDAELVAHMVGGKIGGVIFFQDPMDAHPHRVDIDCLVRQALVHNVVLAETPSSALMICQTLRQALIGKGRPELIPSFFFKLQSPTVEAYKAGQKKVVDSHKK